MKRNKNFQREEDERLKSSKKPMKEKPAKNLKRSIMEEMEEEEGIDYYKDEELSLENFYDEDDDEEYDVDELDDEDYDDEEE